jgi:beta-lactamase regulating signal transducer with metallopeptidase domain
VHEHVAPAVYYLEVHFLYASVVCLAAWVLTSLWQGGASWKYWVWVVTLLNFILPFAGLFDRFGASSVSWATQLPVLDEIGIEISRHPTAGNVLFAVWLCGAAIMATRLMARVRDERRNGRPASGRSKADVTGGFLAHGVPVRFSAIGQEPSVAGVLRPYILLPFGTEPETPAGGWSRPGPG